MSHMNESCLIWISHVSYESVMSHMNQSCHTEIKSGHFGKRDISMSESCHMWGMSHMNESCLIWMSHVSYKSVLSHFEERDISMSESCHMWGMSRMDEPCHRLVVGVSMARGKGNFVLLMSESCLIWMSHVSYGWVVSQRRNRGVYSKSQLLKQYKLGLSSWRGLVQKELIYWKYQIQTGPT